MQLDPQIKSEISQYFAKLDRTVNLVMLKSNHPKQDELRQLLSEVAECSPYIHILEREVTPSDTFSFGFGIFLDSQDVGIFYAGVPGGHEFTSLILAILNSCGLGKLPDETLAKQIASIQGPLEIRTIVSLTCENCPIIVQSFQQMALINPSITHIMVEGDAYPELVAQVKSVPTVYINGELFHTGRASFSELLEKVLKRYSSHVFSNSEIQKVYDVTVIGGGPAGASAAIYAARKGLATALVVDRFGGQLQDTVGIENMISQIYTEGKQLAGQLEQHLKQYAVEFYESRKVQSILPQTVSTSGYHELNFSSGEKLKTRTVILATGSQWKKLNVPGEVEYTGRGVAYCPHCDGPLFKGKKVAVVGGGNSGVEAAIDLANICAWVTLIEYGTELRADQVLVEKLLSLSNVSILKNTQTLEIVGNGTAVNSLVLMDRESQQNQSLELDGVFVQIGLSPNSEFVSELVELNKQKEIVTNSKGETSVPGIFAAGDVTNVPFKQIIVSMGEGAKAALGAFEHLVRQVSKVA